MDTLQLGYSDGDVDTNRSQNPSLETLVQIRYSRRQALSGLAAATTAFMGSSLLAACGGDERPAGNTTLVVTAGTNGQTSAGKVVTLSGQAGGSNTGLSVKWEQVSGPAVTLINADSAEARFIAPSVSAPTPLVFRFTANASGLTRSTESVITVDVARLDFEVVRKNLNDIVTVPAGYTATVLYRLGDPIQGGVSGYSNIGTDTNFAGRAGDHHDALYYYGLSASGNGRDDNNSSRGLLVMNHENITQAYLHPNGPTGTGAGQIRPEGEALKEMEAHGVSVVEVSRAASGQWSYNQTSPLNRRITPLTVVQINGPARGHAQLRTQFSPDGTQGRGTINNCANGVTAWGTNLTCEENWAGYFRRPAAVDNPRRSAREVAGLARYGVTSSNGNYGWATVRPADQSSTLYRRWDAQVDPAAAAGASGDFRNEPNQFGWVVELDPYDVAKPPRKRTALGRMNHEGAWPANFIAGRRPTFYMGDDARNEYIFKFVSATPWSAADAQAGDRLAIGDKYLDNGTLYVARFEADGSGTWLPLLFGQGPLTPANVAFPFQDQGDVLIHTRLAADALGATRMDRPEWTAVNPATGEMYITLTNNSQRTAANTNASNPRAYIDPKSAFGDTTQDPNSPAGRTVGNANGHILRLRESGDNSEATRFRWDIYLFGAGADLDRQNINLSGLSSDNDFSSPDGLWFARPTNASGQVRPVLWIETDDGAFTDQTNNQLLAAMPGVTGDGGARTITNNDGTRSGTQTTIVGAVATPATVRRFLTGPKECEITGIDTTPDGRSLFINVQHPGEDGTPANPTSNWPASQNAPAPGSRPRSATVVITKNDGGVVGL
jgi:secreted PhoX family phosphatase